MRPISPIAALLLLLPADAGAFVSPPRATFVTPRTLRASVAASFEDLTLDQKVAMVRVAKCLAPRPEDEPGAFAAPAPVTRPEWANPTNATWVDIRESYPDLDSLDDITLATALAECREMQATAPPAPVEGGVGSGAVPIALAATAIAVGLFLNSPGVTNPACGSSSLPQAAQRACAEQAARAAS